MKFLSKTEILNNICNINDRYQLINIIAPPFSGKSQLIEEIKNDINLKAKTLTFVQTSNNFINNEIVDNLVKSLNIEYGLNIEISKNNTSLCDTLYSILKNIDNNILNSIYFLIDDVDKIGTNKFYMLLSQLRNLREKITSDKLPICIVIICIGSWKPSELRKECEINLGSYFPEEMYLNDNNIKEVSSLITKYKVTSFEESTESYIIKYLYEISGGCYAIIDYVLKNIGNNFKCNTIREKAYNLINKEFFINHLKNSFSKLNEYSIDIINKILSNKIIKYRNKEIDLYEELLLSGIVKKVTISDIEVIAIRSWIHEITIRSNKELRTLLGNEKLLSNYKELIPPTPSINQVAYEIVLEIENRLRNYLLICLSEKMSNNINPFRITDSLGKINDKWNKQTLFEELKYQKNKVENLYSEFVDAYSSLSSFLSTSDLLNMIVQSYDKPDNINLYDTLFPNNDNVTNMFNRFRIIRNQIAHNNIVTENTVDELIKIKKEILQILTI